MMSLNQSIETVFRYLTNSSTDSNLGIEVSSGKNLNNICCSSKCLYLMFYVHFFLGSVFPRQSTRINIQICKSNDFKVLFNVINN